METSTSDEEKAGRAQVPRVIVLTHGFLRLRCADCAHEKLVAFSCKRRGFCPACGARRMAETATHLVDCVIPQVPVRQWVLSFPIPLRYLFAAHPQLHALVLQIVNRVISGFLIQQAGLKRTEADTGAVTKGLTRSRALLAYYSQNYAPSLGACPHEA